MRQVRRTVLAAAAAQVALLWAEAAFAQTAPAPEPKAEPGAQTVVVRGQRAALGSAQKIKQEAEEVVDSIVADDIGKLPDRSITEVLQRVVGVTIDRTMAKTDPEHFSVEGSGVIIRGLTYVRSELNGRDSFSANGGRALNFEDVPPELMAGVDVYKNPSAEHIEGAISGLVNLRTAMPLDYDGLKGAVSLQGTYSQLRGTTSPSASMLISNRWRTEFGQFGALISVASSESQTRTDAFQVEPYYPRDDVVAGQRVWVPKGSQWRTLEFDRDRKGLYGALQWRGKDIESSLSYFKSDYKMNWAEQAIFAQSSPYAITVDPGARWDANGAFLAGTIRSGSGINYGDDTRVADRASSTQDLSWKLSWKASDRWSFSTDLQLIKAKTSSFDSTVATGVQMPQQTIDLTGSYPRLTFSDADRAFLADPANYYWAFTMEHRDKSDADSKAWRADAKFSFDHPVLSDLRFGMRLTEREAVTTNTVPGYNWSAITQPWQVGWDISGLAFLSDPRFSGGTRLHQFKNFFGGKASVPSLVFPEVALAKGYPASYAQLHTYHDILCAEQTAAQGWSSGCAQWQPASFGTDPAGSNDQREKTQAAYAQLRFGFDDWKMPVDGNIGLRLVRTQAKAHGYTVFSPSLPSIPPGANVVGTIPEIPAFAEAEAYEKTYTNVLPSLNLKMNAGDGLQYRLAMSQGVTRPDFTTLQGYTTLEQTVDTTTVTDPDTGATTVTIDRVTHKGTAAGNPLLEPVKSSQIDLTAEWYFARTGSITVAGFYKRLKDVVVNQSSSKRLFDTAGQPHDFLVTSPINGASGSAKGVEIAVQRYFDMLPGWLSGFGVQANYTYVDSKTRLYQPVDQIYCAGANNPANLNLNLNGCDTDGRTFGDLPLPNLSRHTYNLALLYDHGPLSARLAYSWRSKYLQAVNVNGTNGGDGLDTNPDSPTFGQTNVAWALPTWGADYGQLDLGIFYKVNEQLTIGFEGQNLTDELYKQLMQQHVGLKGRAWFSTGPRYTLQARYSF